MLKISKLSVMLGQSHVLREITLTLRPGLNVLVGPNGSGKTTLARSIAGLVTPDHGNIIWQGNDLQQINPAKRADQISYLAQNPVVHWPITVKNLVTLGQSANRQSDEAKNKMVISAMNACNIIALGQRRMDQLSGGERARVLLARALAVNADLLLVDEPTSSLDPAQQLAMMKIIHAEGKRGKTVLCILHDLSLAARFADRLLLLFEGKLLAEGPPDQLLCSKTLHQAFDLTFDAQGHLVLD